MGLIQSKPENLSVRDRVRLCDGLEPLFGATVAAAGAGRYLFILGERKSMPQPDGTEMTSLQLDYIDLMLSTRVRILLGDFCDFGVCVGFYALDERTVVLVDVEEAEDTLRQRLVVVDPEKATAHAFLDRCYQLDTRDGRPLYIIGLSAVSEDRVITKVPVYNDTGLWQMTMVYPKNPMDLRCPVDDITSVLIEASDRLGREVNTPGYQFFISTVDAPFFLSPTKIGFFVLGVDIRSAEQWLANMNLANVAALVDSLRVDHSSIVACDLETEETSIIRFRPDPVTNFPCNQKLQQPYDSLSVSGSNKELGLLVTDRFSARDWHAIAERLLGTMAERMASLYRFFGREPFEMRRLSMCFIKMWKFFSHLRRRVLAARKVRFGLLNTSTMEWQEQKGVADQMRHNWFGDKLKMAVFPDGHFIIYDQASNSDLSARHIGCNISSKPKEELRVLSNPGRCFSLKTLAEMQVRKRPIARLAIMQIAARIQY